MKWLKQLHRETQKENNNKLQQHVTRCKWLSHKRYGVMNHKIIVKTNGNINNDNSAPNLIYLVSVQITKLKESMHDFHMNQKRKKKHISVALHMKADHSIRITMNQHKKKSIWAKLTYRGILLHWPTVKEKERLF